MIKLSPISSLRSEIQSASKTLTIVSPIPRFDDCSECCIISREAKVFVTSLCRHNIRKVYNLTLIEAIGLCADNGKPSSRAKPPQTQSPDHTVFITSSQMPPKR